MDLLAQVQEGGERGHRELGLTYELLYEQKNVSRIRRLTRQVPKEGGCRIARNFSKLLSLLVGLQRIPIATQEASVVGVLVSAFGRFNLRQNGRHLFAHLLVECLVCDVLPMEQLVVGDCRVAAHGGADAKQGVREGMPQFIGELEAMRARTSMK
jgi:hypothetical protein